MNCSQFRDEPIKLYSSGIKAPSYGNFGGNHVLLVKLNGAKELLKLFKPALNISDGLVILEIVTGNIKHYGFIPSLFKQKDKQHYE